MGFPEQMGEVETGTYAGILSLDHVATPYAYANETQPRSYRGEQRPKSTASSDPGKRSTN